MFCIKCIVKLNLPDKVDIKNYLYKNRAYYVFFGVSFFVGVTIGVVLSFSNQSFYELLSTNKKLVYSVINGTIDYFGFFWKVLLQFCFPLLLMFLLNLNFYLGVCSYLFTCYQSAVMVVSASAIISTYGFSGVFNAVFLLLPINIVYFVCLFFYGAVCRTRAKEALKNKNFAFGLDAAFLQKTIIAILMVVAVSLIASVILPLTLKNVAYIIY